MSKIGVYLDYQASTPLDPRVRAVMAEAYHAPGNSSSEEHSFGWAAAARVEGARQLVADCVGALSEEVMFTSGATEANNIAVIGAALGAPMERRRILISSIEHKSVSEAAFAAERWGFKVDVVPVTPAGVVDLQRLENLLGNDVAVVSVMAVSNEIGTIQPVPDIARLVDRAGAFFHTDATQAPAAQQVDFTAWGAHALSLSGHKIYGPGGVGALLVALNAPWRPQPLMFGGGQEQGLRPGTVPVALCVGLGEASRLISMEGLRERQRVAQLRDALRERICAVIPGLRVTCETTARHPGCLHVRLPGISASDLILRVQPGLALSSGSACTSGLIAPSYVAQAIGMSSAEASSVIRLSVGRYTTEQDLDEAANLLALAFEGYDLRRDTVNLTHIRS